MVLGAEILFTDCYIEYLNIILQILIQQLRLWWSAIVPVQQNIIDFTENTMIEQTFEITLHMHLADYEFLVKMSLMAQ